MIVQRRRQFVDFDVLDGFLRTGENNALSEKIVGAGDGDRTRMASLEGWSSTIELHPHLSKTEKTHCR